MTTTPDAPRDPQAVPPVPDEDPTVDPNVLPDQDDDEDDDEDAPGRR